ncbi:MAG: hypothetical protein ABSG86_19820 [Thermoguttaceae bacterium]|jgi:hypothetical protein
MSITTRASLAAAILVLVVVSGSSRVHAAGPQLCGSSISVTNGEPWLLYGVGLDDPGLKIHIATLEPGKEWDAVASLDRLFQGKTSLPVTPPHATATVGVYASDAHTAAVKPFSNRWQPPAKIVWAETSQGISPPLAINRPEVWTLNPPHLIPGTRARVFGPNMGSHICLVGPGRRITPCRWSYSFSLEKGLSPAFERTFEVPADLPPGIYQLYVNGGGGDCGWSRPRPVEVIALANPTSDAIPVETAADGQTPCAAAIQKGIDAATAAGGGTVLLKPGQYRLEATVRIKPGVTLRGSGVGATTLLPPRQGKIPATFHDYRPLVEMHEQAGLEYLSVDASEADDHHALLLLQASDSAIRHCRIVNLNPAVFPAGKWVPADVVCTAVGHTRNLVVLDNEFRGTMPFSHWGGTMTGAWIAHNRFEGLPTQNSNFSMRGMRECIFEHNRVLNSGRGIVVAGEAVHNYFGYNRIENIRGIANGCEMFLYEMGNAVWHGRPAKVEADSFTTADILWDKKSLHDGAGDFQFTAYAMVTAGRGMGQCIPVASAEGQTVRLAWPWTLPPDGESEVAVVHGCMENLHVENQFKDGVAYSGPFGSAVRNIWAGEEFEAVSDGMVLWAIDGPRQMSLNLIRDLRLKDRAGILILSERSGDATPPVTKTFGNEIRTCQVYHRERYPGNEYGLGERVWRYPINSQPSGNARHVKFGQEAGIHLSQLLGWPGSVSDDDAKLDQMPPTMRWNLIYDCLVARSPIGIRVGRGIDHTVIVEPFSAYNDQPISDAGRQTVIVTPTVQPVSQGASGKAGEGMNKR